MTRQPRPFLGLIAGVAAGVVAAAAMAAFQSLASNLVEDSDAEPATEKAADAVSEVVTGHTLPAEKREAGGQMVHYVVGAVMGGIYGVLTEYRPEASAGFGSAYGVATSALLDETAVPALDLGPDADEVDLGTHAYGLASHLVFGVVLEGIRWLIAGKR
jgi:putative membrane protein